MNGRPTLRGPLLLSLVGALIAACGGTPTTTAGQSQATPTDDAPGNPTASAPLQTAAPASETPGATASPGPPAPLPPGSWSRLAPGGPAPSAREDHTWTVDEAGGTAYLFGGRDGSTVFDDLWAFDLAGDRWTRLTPDGSRPAARFGHEAAWVPGRGLAVFAGQAGSRFFNDLWLFDPAAGTWSELPPGSDPPTARYGTCSGVGPDGRLWISHGFTSDGVRFSDTHAYDFAAGQWVFQRPGSDIPTVRCLHACWWTSDGQFALYGGQTTGVPALGDLWLLEPSDSGRHQWTEVTGDLPRARQLPAVARAGGVTIVIGGRGRDGQPIEDAWQLVDGTTSFVRLEATGSVPPARSGATLIHDSIEPRLLLFGGLAANERDDLWSFSWP